LSTIFAAGRRHVGGLAFCLLALIPAFAADPADLVREAAAGWTQAAVKQDAAALQRFLADDLQYAHAGGQLQNKEQYMAAVTKGSAHYESFTFSDLKVRFYGKAAVLTAFVDVKMVGQDAFRVRTLQVYTENNGQWQMAAHQSTRIGQNRPGQNRPAR
jgi:ketosteroid isomerase-like protein